MLKAVSFGLVKLSISISAGFQLKSAFDVSLLHPSAFSNQLNLKPGNSCPMTNGH